MQIEIEDLTNPDLHALLHEHLADMREQSPPGSVHALDLDGLRAKSVTFWTVRKSSELMGCGALKELDSRWGEIKSMRTSKAHLRKGVATKLLEHILDEAKRRRYERVNLETGSTDAFKPARLLYERFGFTRCQPFADYEDNSFSVFMTIEL
jgi:putative acetyltransferase